MGARTNCGLDIMIAATEVTVVLSSNGSSVIDRLHCESPLTVRVDNSGAIPTLMIVNTAAGPLSGDEFSFSLHVADGAQVRVRSVAAMLVQPGPSGDWSHFNTTIQLGENSSLDWCTEPLISVQGSRHRSLTKVDAHSTSRMYLSESLLLGRSNELSGDITLRQRIEVDGLSVLDHETQHGTSALLGLGAHGPWRHMRSAVSLGEQAAIEPESEVSLESVRGVFPIAQSCSLEIECATRSTTSQHNHETFR